MRRASSLFTKRLELFVRRDFPGQHAELINVPIADNHLDRGCCCLSPIHSLVALSLYSQARKLRLSYCAGIANHAPSPSKSKTCALDLPGPTIIRLPEKSVLDLTVHVMQPLLRPFAFLAVSLRLSF